MDPTIELQKAYARRFAGSTAYRDAFWRILCEQYFQPMIGLEKDILDLGAGWGEFINHIRGRRKYAMDLNPDGATRVTDGVTFLMRDCAQVWPLSDNTLDVVFTSNFLEHLSDRAAVNRTLAQAFRCLKPGGRIICLGPNIKYVGGAYWDFYDHCLPLTHASLAEAMQLADFRMLKIVPRFLPYTMSAGKPPPLTLARFYLKLPVLWRWFGRQFLLIGEKAGAN